ncbi:nuclear transport factor 2 family protein [Marivirga harenae]|uniref:nuclear transport factor 2 family protein n=1 Tax=Marivirga harenae TaxID=2010992 RepID=UPI0026E01D38|nr:nuclear transport factor 2 family protein [Marivirga harenae]WKV11059.1 nuclear transport factor 2 family protein [Marivirga harenae]|tara:strand:- start:150337 stop:150792 length:456 start_codon:yes stop_codon:yes gene_type:complete
MKTTLILILGLTFYFPLNINAQKAEGDKQLEQMLHTFMDGASKNDSLIHANFWAEDLIYTSSNGTRFGKKQIMDGFKPNEQTQTENSTTRYTAEDIIVQRYENMAIVAFKMKADSETSVQYYLNSGTFLKRNGKWQVVNWHATISGQPIKK